MARSWWTGYGHTSLQQFSQIRGRNEALEKFADIAQRLGYTGNISDPIVIHSFIENGLRQTKHVRKTYVSKSTPKKAASKSAQHCSNCEKIGHTKTNCSKGRKSKKVNFINQSKPEESEDNFSFSEEQSSEEKEISDEEQPQRNS